MKYVLRASYALALIALFAITPSFSQAQSERALIATQKSLKRPKNAMVALRAARSAKLTSGVEGDLLRMRRARVQFGKNKIRIHPKRKHRQANGTDVVHGVLDRNRGDGTFVFKRGRLSYAAINDIETNTSVQVTARGNGQFLVEEFDTKKFPDCKDSEIAPDAGDVSGSSTPSGNVKVAADGSVIIDVMVVWTPEVEAAKGAAGARALAEAAIASTNQAYINSGIYQRVNLVYAGKVSKSESNISFTTLLSHLRGTTDGYFDEVHALRNQHGADLVSLLVMNKTYCGYAYFLGSSTSGFSVVNQSCAVGSYSFAHELGHNMGAHHDRSNSSGGAVYPYAYGHRFYGTNGKQYRTVMAYAPGTRINYFSNPEVSYYGTPTGVYDRENNALTLNNTAPTVMAYRSGAGEACSPASPTVSLSPSKQSVSAGSSASYTISVRNNDGNACANSTISLSASVPSGISGSLASSSMTLAPGASGSTTILVGSSSSTRPANYSFSVRAIKGSSLSGQAAGTLEVKSSDVIAPTAPTSLKGKSNKKGSISLTWGASKDNVGVTGYLIYRDSTQVAATTSRAYGNNKLKSRSKYTYYVRARDAAGNLSGKSNSITVTIK